MTIRINAPSGPFRDAGIETLREGLTRRGLLGCGAGAAGAVLLGAAGDARSQDAVQPHALAEFFQGSQVAGAALSPSGERVAVLLNIGEGGVRRMVVDLIEAADPSGPRRRVPVGDFDVETLAYDLRAGGDGVQIYVRGTNLLDELALNHTSFIKDAAPLRGRNFVFGVRARF